MKKNEGIFLVGGYGEAVTIKEEKRFVYMNVDTYTVEEALNLSYVEGVEYFVDNFDTLSELEKAKTIERYMQNDDIANLTMVTGEEQANKMKEDLIYNSYEDVCDLLKERYNNEVVNILSFDNEVIELFKEYLDIDNTGFGFSDYPYEELEDKDGFCYYLNGKDYIVVNFIKINEKEVKIIDFEIV